MARNDRSRNPEGGKGPQKDVLRMVGKFAIRGFVKMSVEGFRAVSDFGHFSPKTGGLSFKPGLT